VLCRTKARAESICSYWALLSPSSGIADYLAQKSFRELAARAKRMFSGLCSRPSDAIAKRPRLYVAFLVKDPHTKFQRLATNSARGGRPRIPTQFDFNTIQDDFISFWLAPLSRSEF
jgi:hypothetical protein